MSSLADAGAPDHAISVEDLASGARDSATSPDQTVPPPPDMARDSSMPDLLSPDLAMPDLALPDLAMPDLVPACTGTLCSGACVDLTSDGSNCGACGHSCGGEMCQSGLCVPEVVDYGISAGAPISLALDGSYVYWSDGSTIYRKAKDGTGGRTTVATHALPSGNSGNAIGQIDVDSTYVYFAANGFQPSTGGAPPQVMRTLKDGSASPTVCATTPGGVANQGGAQIDWIAATDPNSVYYTASQWHAGGVYSFLKSNPPGSTAGSGPLGASGGYGPFYAGYTGRILLDAAHLYMTGFEDPSHPQDGIAQCDLPGCTNLVQIANWSEAGGTSASGPNASLALDSTTVYFTQSPSGTAIASSPKGQDSISFLAVLAAGQPGYAAADDSDGYVYSLVLGASGGVQKDDKTTQNQTPLWLVRNQSSPLGLQLDASHLYWGEGGTKRIWRVAR